MRLDSFAGAVARFLPSWATKMKLVLSAIVSVLSEQKVSQQNVEAKTSREMVSTSSYSLVLGMHRARILPKALGIAWVAWVAWNAWNAWNCLARIGFDR